MAIMLRTARYRSGTSPTASLEGPDTPPAIFGATPSSPGRAVSKKKKIPTCTRDCPCQSYPKRRLMYHNPARKRKPDILYK